MSTGITHKIGRTYSAGTKSFSIPSSSQVADTQFALETTVDKAAVNFFRVAAVDATKIKSIGIHTTQAVTIKTNSSSAPDQTFNLLAGQGVIWNVKDNPPTSCPVSVTISGLYFTGNGTTDADVLFYVLLDQPGVGS